MFNPAGFFSSCENSAFTLYFALKREKKFFHPTHNELMIGCHSTSGRENKISCQVRFGICQVLKESL